MYCQQSGAAFRPFIPRFRRFGGYRLTLAKRLPTLVSLAAHFGDAAISKTVDPQRNQQLFW
jgi:hypothetical protein